MRSGCAELATDDSSYCQPHREADLKYKREWRKRQREQRARDNENRAPLSIDRGAPFAAGARYGDRLASVRSQHRTRDIDGATRAAARMSTKPRPHPQFGHQKSARPLLGQVRYDVRMSDNKRYSSHDIWRSNDGWAALSGSTRGPLLEPRTSS